MSILDYRDGYTKPKQRMLSVRWIVDVLTKQLRLRGWVK